jgi:hypothetical protein
VLDAWAFEHGVKLNRRTRLNLAQGRADLLGRKAGFPHRGSLSWNRQTVWL